MGRGIYIDNKDGRPISITAGMRFYRYCGHAPQEAVKFTGSRGQVSYTYTKNFNNVVAGQPTLISPTEANFRYAVTGPGDITNWISDGTAVGNNTVNITIGCGVWNNVVNTAYVPAYDVWQLDMTQMKQGRGIYVGDSSDFTSITDLSMLSFLTYRWSGTINGTLSLPSNEGSMYLVRWDNPNVVLVRIGNQIHVARPGVYRGNAGNELSAYVEIVGFTKMNPPDPRRGIAMFNRNGQCTFSGMYKPFVTSGWFNPTRSPQNVGDNYVALNSYGARYNSNGSRLNVMYVGLQRSGGNINLQSGYNIYTTGYPATDDLWRYTSGQTAMCPSNI